MSLAEHRVILNVGGIVYETTLETAVQSPMLRAKVVNERGEITIKTKDGPYYVNIDRDGTLFRYVLQYLRQSELVLPEDFNELELLLKEAEFYGPTMLITDILLLIMERDERLAKKKKKGKFKFF